MNQTRADQTSNDLCRKCGKLPVDCSCLADDTGVEWPNLGTWARSQVEMSARFLALREAGTGTVFLQATAEHNRAESTFIGLAPNAIIGGVYQIIDLIGRGGMGEVYLARHLTLDKQVALKVIPPDDVTELSWQRFQLEARAVASLAHVNLVRVTDLGIHEECLPFFAMEYIHGQNLAEALAEKGPMPLAKALEVFMQVCDGVGCAHRGGVLHRDLKPANIMLTQTPSGRTLVKILDFGLAKLTKHDRFKQSLTGSGDVFGSPCYMSPEQCGDAELDSRSDIYSIACTFFECLTGGPPFSGHLAAAVFFGHLEAEPPTLAKVAGPGKFPPLMETIMARMLKKNPRERYQSLSDVKADLEIVANEINPRPDVVSVDETSPAGDQFQTSRMRPRDSNRSAQSIRRPAREAAALSDIAKTPPLADSAKAPPVVPLSNRPQVKLWLAFALVFVTGLASGLYFQMPRMADQNIETTRGLPGSPEQSTGLPQSIADVSAITAAPGAAVTAAAGTAKSPGAVDSPAEAKQEAWNGKPFYQGLVSHDGKQCQHWQYLGHRASPLFLIYSQSAGLQEIPLTGDVYIPASAKVCAMPKQALVHAPPLVDALPGADIDEVDYEWYSPADVKAANPAFAKCTTVRGIRIGNFDWSQDDSRGAAAALNQFPHLERVIFGSYCDGKILNQIGRLNQLKELRLNARQMRLHDCLKALDGSKGLVFFAAMSWGVPSSDLDKVVKCSNLERVMIGQLTGSHEQFAFLAGLSRLHRLELPSLRYRADVAADLKPLKSLKTLKFLLGGDWTEEKLSKLRQELPNVNVVTYKDVTELREAFWLP